MDGVSSSNSITATQERTSCEITGDGELELLHEFRQFPVFMGCTHQSSDSDLLSDMSWCIARKSGFIQLGNLLPLEILYPEAHGSGAVGAIWRRHHQEFARFVHRFRPGSVLEIGGGHGILSKEYMELDDIPWSIIEPNPTPIDGCKASFIRGFFDDKVTFERSFDAVVHSHVLEHIYHPRQFIANIARVIGEDSVLCFSLPNMEKLLTQKSSNCLNFEHTVFLTEPYIEVLLGQQGLEVVAKEYFLDNHSIFYAARKSSTPAATLLPDGLYEKNRKIFLDFVAHYQETTRELNERIKGHTGPIFLFGGHVFSQYLINFGLDVSRIEGILDNDPNKHGKRLYGSNLQVASPAILAGMKEPVVILKAGPYNPEIKAGILGGVNSTTLFWE